MIYNNLCSTSNLLSGNAIYNTLSPTAKNSFITLDYNTLCSTSNLLSGNAIYNTLSSDTPDGYRDRLHSEKLLLLRWTTILYALRARGFGTHLSLQYFMRNNFQFGTYLQYYNVYASILSLSPHNSSLLPIAYCLLPKQSLTCCNNNLPSGPPGRDTLVIHRLAYCGGHRVCATV